MALYDTIGFGYAGKRRSDPRVAAQIRDALGAADRVVHVGVGAGAGSYEPQDRRVVAAELAPTMIQVVPIPHDGEDGFLCSYWRRPEAYLDPNVRRSISTISKLGTVGPALARPESDLRSGAWVRRYGHLLERDRLDLGYRVVRAGSPEPGDAP